MLDTVKIRIKNGKINKPENFSPEFTKRSYLELSETEIHNKNNYIKKFIIKSNLIKGEYLPRVEVYEKLNKETQKVFRDVLIEFSVPKLIFDNNLEEISEIDLDNVLEKLQNKLHRMGVETKINFLEDSLVTKVHFGKNMILPNNITMKDIINELEKLDMGKDYDNTVFKRKNIDETLHLYTTSKGYVFYDKIRDILNRKNKSTDKNKTSYEKEMVETYNLEYKEVLRYEYRLNNFHTIKSEVNKNIGRSYDNDITLSDLFNENLWKDIIIKSWNKVFQRPENQLALKFDESKKKNTIRMLFSETSKSGNKVHSQNLAFSSLGLSIMVGEFGMKFIRKECERVWSKKACGDRLKKKIILAVDLMKNLKFPESIDFADTELKKFERLTKNKLDNVI